MLRTHTCGELNEKHIGSKVTLCGWVHARRDHGGLLFIDMRDFSGMTQVVFNPEQDRSLHQSAGELRSESVILIKGVVRKRPEGTENAKLPTGAVEVMADTLEVFSAAMTPPIEVEEASKASEELRLKYRYLDLRRPSMQKRLRLRHNLYTIIRAHLSEKGFIETETPILTKSTPEGARDYLVPSRLSPGNFYALPQSPQLFKQILMVAGLDRYYQIARCFRDEDLRKDRQPEFTQLDLEMSFIEEEDIYLLIEDLLAVIFKELQSITMKRPIPRMAYETCMRRYGSDKPDIRFGMEFVELTDQLRSTEYKILQNVIKAGGAVFALCARGAASFSIKEVEEVIQVAKDNGAKGLSFFRVKEGSLTSTIDKFFTKEQLDTIARELNAADGDLILAVGDQDQRRGLLALGAVREYLIRKLNLKPREEFAVLWVTDFPLLKYNEEEKRWDTEHHPFTSPKAEDIALLDKETEFSKVRAKAYDLVINGVEIASGSIRIHDRKLQEKIFKTIGIDKEKATLRFGFLLEAFKYGAPPHGGIAFGLDRFITLFLGGGSIREVIAFPKTQKGICLLTDAPTHIDEAQLKELGLKLRK